MRGAERKTHRSDTGDIRRPSLGLKATANKSHRHGPYRVDCVAIAEHRGIRRRHPRVLIALAGLALFVAVQTVRDRRKFQPPMTTWYAAMLFAVVPLRNALPDAPPFGSWVDVTIVLWVIVVLVISMLLYIAWWTSVAKCISGDPTSQHGAPRGGISSSTPR